MTIRAIVVDDEELGRRGVLSRLARHEGIEIIAQCANGREAVDAITDLRPDLMFLDIQMPGMDGFALLQAIPTGSRPHIIFITAFDQHALRAFEVHALDYLLKPIDDERFDAAVLHAITTLEKSRDGEIGRRIAAMLAEIRPGTAAAPAIATVDEQRFVIRSGGRIRHIPARDLQWVEAAGDYVRLHTAEKPALLRETMAAMASRLDPARFIRIHRSAIVAIDQIRELHSLDNGDYRVILRDSTELRLSRSYHDAVERLTR